MGKKQTPNPSENALEPKTETPTPIAFEPKSLLAPEGFVNEWRPNVRDEEYHADRTAVGSTQLRLMLQSPKSFITGYKNTEEKIDSDALRFGKLIHLAILEPELFAKSYVVMPNFGDMHSSLRRAERDAWIEGQSRDAAILKNEAELEQIFGMVRSLKEHKRMRDFMKDGRTEVAGYYRDPETGIRLKLKPDFLSNDGVRLNDLKSCLSSDRRAFGDQAYKKRYDLQMYMYAEGIQHITGKFPEVISLIAVEKTPPYESAIYYFKMDEEGVEGIAADLYQAKVDYRMALTRLKASIDKNYWPQRQREFEQIQMPQWFVYAASERN